MLPTIVDLRVAVDTEDCVWLMCGSIGISALGTARDLSIPLILVGNVNTSICILENILKPSLKGARSTTVSLPKKRSQILGRIMGDDIFILSQFAKAIRKASRVSQEAPNGYWSLLRRGQNPNRHIHSDVLHAFCSRPAAVTVSCSTQKKTMNAG